MSSRAALSFASVASGLPGAAVSWSQPGGACVLVRVSGAGRFGAAAALRRLAAWSGLFALVLVAPGAVLVVASASSGGLFFSPVALSVWATGRGFSWRPPFVLRVPALPGQGVQHG